MIVGDTAGTKGVGGGGGGARHDDIGEGRRGPALRAMVPPAPRAVLGNAARRNGVAEGLVAALHVVHEAERRVGHGEALVERHDVEDVDADLVARLGTLHADGARDDVHDGNVAVRLVKVHVGVRLAHEGVAVPARAIPADARAARG